MTEQTKNTTKVLIQKKTIFLLAFSSFSLLFHHFLGAGADGVSYSYFAPLITSLIYKTACSWYSRSKSSSSSGSA